MFMRSRSCSPASTPTVSRSLTFPAGRATMAAMWCALAIACFAAVPAADAQANEWTWTSGSSTTNQTGVYGTLGVAAAANIPGSRSDAATWTDHNGNLWLFGGNGYDANGNFGYLGDLWKYNASLNQWTWMAGTSTSNLPGVYGTLGTPAAENTPGGRIDGASWTDSNGNLWLFGGFGYDSQNEDGYLNDLWEYNVSTSQWTWVGGNNLADQPGTFGTKGVPAAGNLPSGRDYAATWVNSNGNFWLLGGQTDVVHYGPVYGNDLWKFSPTTKLWTWMAGTASYDSYGVYGTLGVPDPGNTPGTGSGSSSWTDRSGNLWLFGGYSYGPDYGPSSRNELWQFNPSTNQWAWMGGNFVYQEPGVYGTLGTPAPGNMPGGRDYAAATADENGNLFLFSGLGLGDGGDNPYPLNDLWQFNLSENEWTWMGGGNTVLQPGVYGTQGVPSAANVPGARLSALSWKDNNNNFWVFGGWSIDDQGNQQYFNDLWKFQLPALSPLAATPTFSVAAGTYSSAQTVAISDATPNAIIYYTADGTTPTTGSTRYTGAITVPSTETIQAIAAAPGDSNSYIASATYLIPVNTTTALTTSLNPSFAGQSVTFTATVTPASGAAVATGSVQFSVNGAALGSPVGLDTQGGATYTTSTLPVGNLTITAAYTPAAFAPFLASNSSALTVSVLNTGQLTGNVWFNNAVRTLGSGFLHPYGVAVDANDNVFVADSGNSAVKEIVAAGGYATINSLGSGFQYPSGIAIDASNNLFVTDAGSNGLYELPAGNYANVQDLSRSFNSPYGVAVDAQENLFIADTGHGEVRFMSPCASCGGGYGTAITLSSAFEYPWGVAVDAQDNLYVTDAGKGAVQQISAAGGAAQSIGGSFFATPYGVAAGANGTVFVTDLGNQAVRQISAVDGFSTVSTPASGLNVPIGVAVDANGNLFVADTDNNAVKEVSQVGNFGTVNVGSTSSFSIAMVFFFDAPTKLGSTAVLAQQGGAASVDFADAGGDTCTAGTTYAANTTCTVNLVFTPTQFGSRNGVVELLDGSGNVLAAGSVQGMGFLYSSQIAVSAPASFQIIQGQSPLYLYGGVTGSGPVTPTGTVTGTSPSINVTATLDANGNFVFTLNTQAITAGSVEEGQCTYSGDSHYLRSTLVNCFEIRVEQNTGVGTN